jgi:invasion protein IalB
MLSILSASAIMPSISDAQDVAAKPQISAQKFDDWYYRCSGDPQARACEVAQIAQVPKDGKNVNVLTLAIAPAVGNDTAAGKKAKTGLMLTALLPLNVFLPAGLSITSSGKPVTKLSYRNCNQAGCWAQQALDARMLASLDKSGSAEGLVRLMDGQNVNIRFSLKGLKPALEKLQSVAVK